MVPADQRAPQLEERLVDVGTPLVAHLQPPKAVQTRQRPFHDPSVPAQALARLDAPPGDVSGYALLTECFAAAREVVALVGVQLLGPLSRAAMSSADRSNGVDEILEHPRVVDVSRRVPYREWNAVSVDHKVAL